MKELEKRYKKNNRLDSHKKRVYNGKFRIYKTGGKAQFKQIHTNQTGAKGGVDKRAGKIQKKTWHKYEAPGTEESIE
ncbi:MAG TPA: hypothetical protein IAD32_02010 [Candidatus Scatavimonas merdigallinarum]|uniref:Uncharacterized protein n=1 Tax=Candidatus Scatavimonas merdigallinarum TaxID=2840914 RepID=A0A9D0ZG92_9FIRM|nr:hypothetical protein [Candidatus Scatavimonas merdigallinarum]